ncbi:MAG: C-GCAxxG-C-C family (seleno)protein [Candidatus Helarchaeota archaeon]
MIDVEKVEKRFKAKIEELRRELPKKYHGGNLISQNCAMLTMKSFLEIIEKENINYINMAGPLAALAGVCGAVNAGLMITGLVTGKFGKKEIHQLKAAEQGMRFLTRFRHEFDSYTCQTLTGGYNLLTTKGMQDYIKDEIWEKKCYKHVVKAIEILGKLYKKQLGQFMV